MWTTFIDENGKMQVALGQDESQRSLDAQGFFHVNKSNISKANVCPYRGDEIPGWQNLGLDPHKTYQLLRPADELKKAADSFNMIPIMDKHIPVSAFNLDDPEIKKHHVGTTGHDAAFDGKYLTNRLAIHQKSAIDKVLDDSQRELSCGYRYEPDMTPGTFEGQHYDGKMTSIVGNHVALVSEGRAGHDVLVGDEAMDGGPGSGPHEGGGSALEKSVGVRMAQIKTAMQAPVPMSPKARQMMFEGHSKIAERATTFAKKNNSPLAHEMAANEHKLAEKSAREAGNHAKAEEHAKQADYHLGRSDKLSEDAKPNYFKLNGAFDIAKREDVDPEEGEEKYGDVEYMDEKNKKYPLDAKHIGAAASYWGMPKNKAMYPKADQVTMTKKLKAAQKRLKVGEFSE